MKRKHWVILPCANSFQKVLKRTGKKKGKMSRSYMVDWAAVSQKFNLYIKTQMLASVFSCSVVFD